MLCGEGRAGKTSTRRALLGEPFDPKQPSTRGTQQSLTTVNKTVVSGEWKKYKPEIIGEQHIHAVAKKLAAVTKKEITIEDLQRENVVSADVLEWYREKINPNVLPEQEEETSTQSDEQERMDVDDDIEEDKDESQQYPQEEEDSVSKLSKGSSEEEAIKSRFEV